MRQCKAPSPSDTLPVMRTAALDLPLPDLPATAALAAALAPALGRGDVVTLTGDLGTGKTTLVRFLLQSLYGTPVEVPSPTFTLLQTYPLPSGLTVWHFDLYRLGQPEDVLELGWEEALATGLALVEWPDRLGPLLPACLLDIRLTFAEAANAADWFRTARLIGSGAWVDRLTSLDFGLLPT